MHFFWHFSSPMEKAIEKITERNAMPRTCCILTNTTKTPKQKNCVCSILYLNIDFKVTSGHKKMHTKKQLKCSNKPCLMLKPYVKMCEKPAFPKTILH